MLVNLPQMVTKDVFQARQKGPAMSHELHDYAEIYTPSREEPAPWIGPQVTIALLFHAVEVVKVVKFQAGTQTFIITTRTVL